MSAARIRTQETTWKFLNYCDAGKAFSMPKERQMNESTAEHVVVLHNRCDVVRRASIRGIRVKTLSEGNIVNIRAFAIFLLGLFCTLPVHAEDGSSESQLLYRKSAEITLPSTNTYWDYAKIEPGGKRLFIARADDGLTVFDVDQNQVIATVENSVGANGPVLLPQYDRGYVAMNDGSLLSFELKSLKVLQRQPFATDGGLNSGSLDSTTTQVHFITGARSEQSTWFTLDAQSGSLIKTTTFPFRKMDDPAADGKGHLFAPVRYDDLVLKLDSKTLKVLSRWEIGCHVSKLRYQEKTDRLLGMSG